MNAIHPKNWTLLTWFAIMVWLMNPVLANIPFFQSKNIDFETRNIIKENHYQSIAELPYPFGWPVYYIRPPYLSANNLAPMPGLPPPAPIATTFHPLILAFNALVISITVAAFVYVLQSVRIRFSLLFLFGLMTAFPIYYGSCRLVAVIGGYSAVDWYKRAIYFLPIPVAIGVRYSLFSRCNRHISRVLQKNLLKAPCDYSNAEDVLVEAAKLESRGLWQDSISLYTDAAERRPEHKTYVQQCIRRINEKQGLAE